MRPTRFAPSQYLELIGLSVRLGMLCGAVGACSTALLLLCFISPITLTGLLICVPMGAFYGLVNGAVLVGAIRSCEASNHTGLPFPTNRITPTAVATTLILTAVLILPRPDTWFPAEYQEIVLEIEICLGFAVPAMIVSAIWAGGKIVAWYDERVNPNSEP